MRNVMVLAAAAALMCSAAQANEAAKPAADAKRVVYLCDESVATKRSFERLHGAVAFVTAEEARHGAWAGARCMSRTEYQKLKRIELKQLASR